ncbi:nitrite reductase small subunit NirD [Parendozoicomonas sp. Alg238-R29]|uniref:nitrite reductase small subunit NirD n=1 Tax=Parendozoicomonas sp. Alg238-R29 TaxID=2993446 RepID=UPI00248F055E|nr:nitrite reductase small subunit NirD [Parendozoicomonas sp. Alg238-R29]
MEWATVCSAGEVTELLGIGALIFDHQVAVFKVDGELYAIDNFDPFSQANVLSRGIVGDLKGELVVASPIYKQHFSLKAGTCLEDGTVSIAVHPVRVQDGMVQVALGSPVSQQAA